MQADLSAQTPIRAHPLTSVESGKAWFQTLPAADPKAAMDAVNLALTALLATDYAGAGAARTLQVLETLRKPMATLSGDLSARYAGKSLPLSETQRAAFDSNITLAWTLAYVYYSLIEASQEAAGDLGARVALIHQRAVFWTARGMEEHLRAHQSFADEDWDLAQFVLQSADRLQILETEVRDSLQPSGVSSVAATYVRLLLLHLTGARSLTTREFECARELAHFLEGKADLSYVVADSQGVVANASKPDDRDVRVVQTGSLVHFLGVAALTRNLRSRYDSLAQGKMFDSPVLSDPPGTPALKALISKLRTAWCSRTNLRQFPRRPANEDVYAAFEPAAIYALMKRRNYVAPPPPKVYDHHEVADIYLRHGDAQQRGAHTDTGEAWSQAKTQLEVWRAHDQSATGMRLTRAGGGARMRQGQLMALRLGDTGTAVVALVRWATQTSNKAAAQGGADSPEATALAGHIVEVGIQILPGLPRAGAVRHTGTRAMTLAREGKAAASAALILDNPAGAAPRPGGGAAKPAPAQARQAAGDDLPEIDVEPAADADAAGVHSGAPRYSADAALLLPTGWAREGEVIEFIDGPTTLKLRLGVTAHRHGDIDRVSFQTVQ